MSIHYAHKVGFTYEYFVLEQIRKDYDKVWHWKDFPEKLMYDNNLINNYDIFCKYRYDIGADLVAFKDNKYYFIQCKNYNDTILMENLAGFYFLLYEYNLTGILYYNGKLSQRVIDLSTSKIQFINLPFNNSTIDIIPNIEKPLIIRDYQQKAYNQLLYKKSSILSLPCGMGKTYTTSLMAKHYDNIIILSPLRYLTFQTLEQYKKYLGTEYSPILISLDGKRKIEDIYNYIKEKNIISSTYDSVDIVIQLINKLNKVYLIIDEFHNLSNNNINDINNYMYKLINYDCDKIFVSATPLKDFMNITDIYNYEWKYAIINKYICDFDIYIPDNNENYYIFVDMIKKTCNNNVNEKIIIKAYFMLKGMLFNGDKKCICYMTSIDYANSMIEILSWLSKLLNIDINYWQIDCNTKKTIREKIINNFKESEKIAIIINVHILDEGINIPECDSVFITQPSNNIINIIQRMCRANRIIGNKNNCNIYLWCKEKKTDLILNYINSNTQEFIKNKVFIFNTEKKILDKYIINKLNENHNIDINSSMRIKITEFLKKYSLINNEFIDDFYSFYDEGKNEFDYTINLEKMAIWLDVRKDNLKTLLQSNFKINEDYIMLDKKINVRGIGKGKNNVKTIMLRYSSAKELTMISRSQKASTIRNFYIEIESLLIKYKESIIRDLNQQLAINETNKQLIQKHKNKGLIYVLQIDNSEDISSNKPIEVKIGSTNNLEERIKSYNIGRAKQLKIVFIYLTDQITELETCIKQNLKFYQIKHKTETFEVDLDFIKETIKFCTLKNALLLKKNNKLLNDKNDKKFLIIIDKDNIKSIDKIVDKINNKKNNKKTSKISKNIKNHNTSKTSKNNKKLKTSKKSKASKNNKKPKTSKNNKKPKTLKM